MELKHLNSEEEFNEFVKEGNVIIDFFATWCGPCRMLSPIMEELADERPELKIAKLDVDQVSQVASRYRIASIPTLFFFKDGTLVADQVGYVSKEELEDIIDKAFTEQTYSF